MIVLVTVLLDLMRADDHRQIVLLQKLLRDVSAEEARHFAIVILAAALATTRIRIAPKQVYCSKRDKKLRLHVCLLFFASETIRIPKQAQPEADDFRGHSPHRFALR